MLKKGITNTKLGRNIATASGKPITVVPEFKKYISKTKKQSKQMRLVI